MPEQRMELDADEAGVLVASVLLTVAVGIRWYARLFAPRMTPLKAILATRLLMGALPLP